MSEATAQMDPAAAQGILTDEVYVPAFVEKCAELGIKFQDEDSLTAALETVSMLKTAEAGESSNLVKDAHAALRQASGLKTSAEEKAEAAQEKAASEKAAATAAQNRIREAVGVLAGQQ